jgi:hypothetical protein
LFGSGCTGWSWNPQPPIRPHLRNPGPGGGKLETALRQLRWRCGELNPQQLDRVRSLPLVQLEALAEALLDFSDANDLEAWLHNLG